MLELSQMKKLLKGSLTIGLAMAVVFSLFLVFSCSAPITFGADEEDNTEETDAIQDDISDVQKKLDQESAARQKLQGELNQIQYSVNTTQQEINKTQSNIDEVEENIARYDDEIKSLEERTRLQKEILSGVLRQMYYSQSGSIELTAINYGRNGQFLGDEDRLASIEQKIVSLMEEIRKSKADAEKKKEDLSGEKQKHEELLGFKKDQQGQLLNEKYGTQTVIAQKDAAIRSLQQRLSALRSTLSGFLGESFDAKDIVTAIKFASGKTGVRKEFLMAMLDKESDLGRFTGGCTYSNTRIRESDKEIFKDICDDLDYDYKKQKVSCSLSYGYGGAMGVAQFMPSTWMGYKSAIASMTGHNPPDPWNLTDGVVGMAEKLRRAGGDDDDGEHYAAKVYYCGGPSSSYWNTHCEAYADTVISWSYGYDDYF